MSWSDDEDRFLDLLHYSLQLPSNLIRDWKSLDILLALGGSVWRATENGLVRRVDPTTMQAFATVTATQDSASDELAEAWSKAYGRHPDASDAWDHAIKAIESLLIPIVVPTKDKANLGSVAGHLKTNPQQFSLGLESTGIGGVPTLEALVRLMWPNPDRHGDPAKSRVPLIEEARAVVHLAVTLVQWARDGLISKK
jgi:hypothetical protein